MGLIGPSRFFKKIIQAQGEGEDFLNCFAEDCIKDKYHFVLKDPYETQKTRQILNFGHTMGHALKSTGAYPMVKVFCRESFLLSNGAGI